MPVLVGGGSGGGGGGVTQQQLDDAIAGLVASAPATLDTLNELAAALGDDENFAATVAAQIAAKVGSATVTDVETLTQAEYDALGAPDPATLYVIVPA